MSLLEAIKTKRIVLKPATTVLTTINGEKFEEVLIGNKTELLPLHQKTAGYVVDTKPDLEMALILPNLYLSSQDVAYSRILLRDNNIKYVLSLGVEVNKQDQVEGVVYKFVEFLDVPESNLLSIFDECFEFINIFRDLKLSGLVHCNAGISRSASVVIGYLMKNEKMDFKTALELVKLKRKSVCPNDGFVKQLMEYEKVLVK